MTVAHVFAGMPVTDYAASLAWYERLLGRPPDVVVKDDESMWQLNGGGWVYVVADVERAGGGLLTVLVDDFEDWLVALPERGIETGPVDVVGGGVRVVIMRDPDGNRVQIGSAPA